MRSLQARLLLAFLAVALAAVVVLGLLVGGAATSAFGDYFAGREPAQFGAMGRMMSEMTEPTASRAMLEQMFGPAERAYLSSVQGALWLAGGLAALVAVALSVLLARQITAPMRALTSAARRVASGDFAQRVPVHSRDELGELATAFNAMAQALDREQQVRRRMAADIAHELRTPLAVIQANLEALLDGVRPLTPRALAEIHDETRLLARLVTDLRDLSLAEAGQLPLTRVPTDLRELASACVSKFLGQGESKGVRLVLGPAEELPPAEVDPDRVAQVLGNLIDNALRHTPPEGAVTVGIECDGRPGMVRVTVHDTGPGIPPEHLPHIFERFYRVEAARTRTAGGSGIGLAVVKQLVEAHGGAVAVESRLGEGATFRVWLPVSAATLHSAGGAR